MTASTTRAVAIHQQPTAVHVPTPPANRFRSGAARTATTVTNCPKVQALPAIVGRTRNLSVTKYITTNPAMTYKSLPTMATTTQLGSPNSTPWSYTAESGSDSSTAEQMISTL